MAKIPGAAGMRETVCGPDGLLPRVATICAVPLEFGAVTGSTSHRTCTLIWSPLASLWNTPEIAAGMPLKLTFMSAKDIESGIELAVVLAEAKLVPKIETSEPGATAPGAKLAEFNAARLESITGVCACAE